MSALTKLFSGTRASSPSNVDEEGALTELRDILERDLDIMAGTLPRGDLFATAIRERSALLDDTLRRLLAYNGHNARRADQHFRHFICFRLSKRAGVIPLAVVREESAGCAYTLCNVRGRGGTTLVFTGARHYQRRINEPLIHEKATIRLFEEVLYVQGARSAVAVLEFDGATLANADLAQRRRDVQLFFAAYPEAFERLIVVGAPRFVHGLWRLLRPLFDERTAARVMWCTDRRQVTEELERWFEPRQIPVWLGGQNRDMRPDLYCGVPDIDAYERQLIELYNPAAPAPAP